MTTATLSTSQLDPVAGVSVNEVWAAQNPSMFDVTIESVAKLCHEVNRLWCNMLGDNSQLPWEQAPDWQRNSAIQGVEYHLTSPTTTPRDSHMNWLATKQKEGWKFAPVKNPDLKEHPCFCSYENLSWQQQVKYHLFYSIVKSLEPQLLRGQTRIQTEGERIMGKTFNPSKDWRIDFMKNLFAQLFDFTSRFTSEQLQQPNINDDIAKREINRSAAVAKTHLQSAKMYTIEALTR